MAQSEVLELKPNCNGCGTTTDLYGSTCKHMTVCIPCGKSLAETGGTCTECGVPIGRLIREYTVKHHVVNKNFFVGRFHQGIPHYSKKKNSDAKWCMHREGLQGRQLTDAVKEKYKSKPWILEDDIGQQQFTGQLEGGQSATYFLLIMQGSDFLAMPAGNWYNFHKVAQYKQLTLEEAEEQMKNRRKTADGYQRWMMKAANNGAAAFSIGDIEQGGSVPGAMTRAKGSEDGPGSDSDKAEEDADEEEARKNRLGMNKGTGGEEDEEAPALELDLDDDEGEKGDDWEHEENFTDDDEGVANDADERDDQVNPEVPPPPEIKQEEEDEEEGREAQQEEPDGLSKSGKELKKLIRKAAKEEDSDGAEDDDGTDEDVDLDNEEIGMSPVLAPTRKEGLKEEPLDVPAKATPVAKSTPPSATTSKVKRKANASEDSKANGSASKKAKSESAKTAQTAAIKKDVNAAVKAATAATTTKTAQPKQPSSNQDVTEDEIMKVLRQSGPIKSTDLVGKFKSRLKTPADKAAFAAILKKISRIQKTGDAAFIVLRS